MADALLPCPFCGGPAMRFRHGPSELACCETDRCPGWHVERCTPAMWNTRAPDPRDARIAALEAGLRDAAEALDRAAGELAEFALILSREPTEANQAWRAANDAGFVVTAKARALLDGGKP